MSIQPLDATKMKISILSILILFSVESFSQKVFTGSYFTSKKDIGFESEIFQFKEDGTFTYVLFGCTGTGLGKGNYEIIEGDSLKLQFMDCTECGQTEIETLTETSDSIKIDLKVNDWYHEFALEGVSVFFPKLKIGTLSNHNGIARFTIPKSTQNEALRIQFIGYNMVEINIPVECSQIKGTVRMVYHWIYDHTNIQTFKIINWKNSKLKLEKYPTFTTSYNKINPTKADQLAENYMGELLYELYKDKINPLNPVKNRQD